VCFDLGGTLNHQTSGTGAEGGGGSASQRRIRLTRDIGIMAHIDAGKTTLSRGSAARVLLCDAPLRRMFGYATELRSRTQGRAVFTMRFDRFDAAS
jgi:translation elongation factor EF-G